jgi:hypothetical protein
MKPVELDEKWSKHPWSDWPPEVQSTPSDQRFGFVSHECINKKIIFISETSRRRDWICNFVLKEHCDIKSVHASCGPSSVTYCLWRWICIVRVCNFFHFDPFKNIFSQIDSRKTIFISGSEHRRQSSWRPSCTTGRPRWWRPRDPARLEGRTLVYSRAPTKLAPYFKYMFGRSLLSSSSLSFYLLPPLSLHSHCSYRRSRLPATPAPKALPQGIIPHLFG